MQASPFTSMQLEQEFREVQAKGFPEPTELCELMAAAGSDKGKGLHNYTVVYHQLFHRYRDAPVAVFELGLGTNKPGAPSTMGPHGTPGASLRAWRDYFPRGRIHGADIDRDILFAEDRIRSYWTDQRDPAAIRALLARL
jgi:hypothetical protein